MLTSLQAVHIIEPANLSLAKNLTQDQDNQALTNVGAVGAAKIGPRTWNDAVFVEVQEQLPTLWHQMFSLLPTRRQCTRHVIMAKGKLVCIGYYFTEII